MKIDITRFCGLSRREDFQDWLKSISVDYYNELINHLKLGKSCGSNKSKMEEIYSKLEKDNKVELMVKFLSDKYPHILIYDNNSKNKNSLVKIEKEPKKIEKLNLSLNELNYHKVFPKYKPGIMLLPHQMILIDYNEKALENRIIEFIRNKIQTDYLILKGPKFYHGYIEYFERRFNSDAVKYQVNNRPIFLYKKNNLK